MLRRLVLLAAVSLGCTPPPPPHEPAPPPAPPRVAARPAPEVDTIVLPRASERNRVAVEELVLPLLAGEWTRSLVVGLLHKESEVYGFGWVHDGKTQIPDGDTLYEIGSVTKVFTALLLAREVEDGTLRPDAPLRDVLPKSVRLPEKDGHPITLIQLATHTSGLPRLPSNMTGKLPNDPYADYDTKLLYAFLSGYELTTTPGEKQLYSNVGAGTLGHALSLHRKQSFEVMLRERLTKPLGMAHTRVDLGDVRESLADGHDDEGNRVQAWNLDVLAGAGAIRSSAFDLLRFLQANISPLETTLGRAILRAREIQFRDEKSPIAYGWFRGENGYWHNGQTAGHHAFLIWDERRKLGVVVLADSGMIFDKLGAQLMRLLRGEAAKLELPPVLELPADKLDRLVGTYVLDEKKTVSVTREGELFYTQLTGQRRFRLFAENETTFSLRAMEARVVFEMHRGRAKALVIHQGGHETRARRKP